MHVCSFLLFPLYHYAMPPCQVYSALSALSFLMPDRRGFLRRIFAIAAMDVVEGLYCLVCSLFSCYVNIHAPTAAFNATQEVSHKTLRPNSQIIPSDKQL